MHVALLASAVLAVATASPRAKKRAARPEEQGQPVMAPVSQPPPATPLALGRAAVRPFDNIGRVRSVTAQRAYLDAGSREGLAVGQVVALARKGQPAGSCTVEAVVERNATCIGVGLRAGDTFPVNPKAAGSLPAHLPPRPGREEQARRLAAVQALAYLPIEHKGKQLQAQPLEPLRRVEVGLAHVSWSSVEAGPIHQERVYAAVRDAEVLGGGRLNLDLTGVYRPSPSPAERFRPGTQPMAWVREASLSWAGPQSHFRLAAGRVLPWLVPGGPTFDGIQVGWRPSRSGEMGLFGGAVPNPITTEPGIDRATAGGYWSWELAFGKSLLRHEARLAWVRLPDSKQRLEAEATLQAWLERQFDVSAQARLATGDYASPNKIDGARVDLGWHRPGLLSVVGGFRYDDNRVPDLSAPSLFAGRTRHGWGAVTWEGLSWLQARVTGGHSRDVVTGEHRTWAGPELVAPRLLGRWGGLALGYAEELGSLSGRSAWVQGDLSPLARARLTARASWFLDHRPSPLPSEEIFGVALFGAAELSPWLRLRLSLLARYALPLSEASGDSWGASALVGLESRY